MSWSWDYTCSPLKVKPLVPGTEQFCQGMSTGFWTLLNGGSMFFQTSPSSNGSPDVVLVELYSKLRPLGVQDLVFVFHLTLDIQGHLRFGMTKGPLKYAIQTPSPEEVYIWMSRVTKKKRQDRFVWSPEFSVILKNWDMTGAWRLEDLEKTEVWSARINPQFANPSLPNIGTFRAIKIQRWQGFLLHFWSNWILIDYKWNYKWLYISYM